MSIVTKGGDQGLTSLMYGRRVSKCHPRVEACGAVDELNAALGMARSTTTDPIIAEELLWVQQGLILIMGELATLPEDWPKYSAHYVLPGQDLTSRLEESIRQLEARGLELTGWALPGSNPGAATLDLARTVCRRAERRVCALQEAGGLRTPDMIVFLNRLSDLLWLMARRAEKPDLPG